MPVVIRILEDPLPPDEDLADLAENLRIAILTDVGAALVRQTGQPGSFQIFVPPRTLIAAGRAAAQYLESHPPAFACQSCVRIARRPRRR